MLVFLLLKSHHWILTEMTGNYLENCSPVLGSIAKGNRYWASYWFWFGFKASTSVWAPWGSAPAFEIHFSAVSCVFACSRSHSPALGVHSFSGVQRFNFSGSAQSPRRHSITHSPNSTSSDSFLVPETEPIVPELCIDHLWTETVTNMRLGACAGMWEVPEFRCGRGGGGIKWQLSLPPWRRFMGLYFLIPF